MTIFRVLTMNTKNPADDADLERRSRELFRVLDAIPGGPPGVLFGQECGRGWQDKICSRYGYVPFGNGVGPGLSKDTAGDNVTVMVDPNYWTILDGDVFRANRAHWRYCHLVRLQHKDGFHGDFASAHLTTKLPGFQAMQLLEVREWAKQMLESHADPSRLVWGADWNSSVNWPSTGPRTEARKLLGVKDARDLLSDAEFDGDSLATTHVFGPSRMTGKQIDAIMVGSMFRPVSGRVIETNRPVPSRAPSDHHFVMATLEAA